MGRDKKYTEGQMIEMMRTCGKECLSKGDLDRNTDIEVGSMTIIRHFGSWGRALEKAGLKPGKITGRKVKVLILKPNLMDRKKPWIGGIDFPITNNISNDKNILHHNEILIWKGHKLNQTYLRSVNEDVRDEIAKDLLNFFIEFDFLNVKYTREEVMKAWGSLCNNKTNIECIDGCKYITNSGTAGHKIYKHFFPNIIKIGGEKRRSVYDVLNNKELLWATIRNRIGNTLLYGGELNKDIGYCQFPMNICISQIEIGCKNSGLASMGSVFKPNVAKSIYNEYIKENDVVLDYSCGFGTRLLGLMACGKSVRYLGYEPNTETYNGLINMINEFGFNAEIKCCGSEDEVFDEGVDFAFSSPPYFNVERYCDEESQCYIKYPNYNEWLEKYWRKTVQNIKKMLNNGGKFVINIGGEANLKMKQMEIDLNNIIKEEGFELIDTIYMKTSKSHLSSKKGDESKKFKLEGIFIYRRKNGSQ